MTARTAWQCRPWALALLAMLVGAATLRAWLLPENIAPWLQLLSFCA